MKPRRAVSHPLSSGDTRDALAALVAPLFFFIFPPSFPPLLTFSRNLTPLHARALY